MPLWCAPLAHRMEITLTLEHGSLHAEFAGGDREELQNELLEFVSFLDENQEKLGKLAAAANTENREGSTQSHATEWEGGESREISGTLSSVAERTRVDETTLNELIEVPDDEEEPPFLNLYKFGEEAEVLGSSRAERQARASLILLYIWKECRGEDEVDSEDLNAALSYSDVSPERRDAMYRSLDGKADNYFNRNGAVSLKPPGEHAAREEIQDLAEKYESE